MKSLAGSERGPVWQWDCFGWRQATAGAKRRQDVPRGLVAESLSDEESDHLQQQDAAEQGDDRIATEGDEEQEQQCDAGDNAGLVCVLPKQELVLYGAAEDRRN